jgi:hypothetical protein
VNIPPSRAAALIVDIAAGRFDPLAGRSLRGVDDRGLLEQEMEDIVARDARALRFSGVEQALCKTGAAHPLSQCLESVDSLVGHQRVADYLKSRPFPHYEAAAGHPGLLMRIGEDGSHTLGRFVNRRFEPSAEPCDP